MDWIDSVQAIGFPAAIAIWLMYQSHIRENRIMDRVNSLSDYVRDTLEGLVREATEAIHELRGKNGN